MRNVCIMFATENVELSKSPNFMKCCTSDSQSLWEGVTPIYVGSGIISVEQATVI